MSKTVYITEKQLQYIKESIQPKNIVDFYKKGKFHLSGESLSDYSHVIIEETVNNIISEFEKNGVCKTFKKEEINEIVDSNEMKDVMKSFDVQKALNPLLWVNGKLNSRVRLRLLDIADDFFDSLDISWVKPKDIILTGSIANYNWSKFSDIDLHIIVDFKEVDERVEFVKDYFDARKVIWNDLHENLKIYGFPVEVYVQDENEEHTASGVYSIEKNDWIVEPEKDALAAIKLDKKEIVNKTIKIADLIEQLEVKCNEETDIEKLEILSKKVKELFDKMKAMRKDALKNGNEMTVGNVTWKALRRLGYINRIVDLKALTYDKINTIK